MSTTTRAMPARHGDPDAARQVDIHAVIEDAPHPRETVIVRNGQHMEAVVNRHGMGPYTEALLSPYPDASPGDWEWIASLSCTHAELDTDPNAYLSAGNVGALITDQLRTRRRLRATVRDLATSTVLAVHDYTPEDDLDQIAAHARRHEPLSEAAEPHQKGPRPCTCLIAVAITPQGSAST